MKNLQPSKKSSRLFILLGVVLTVLSMIGVYAISSGSSKPAAAGSQSVIVAAKIIPFHTVFGSAADVAAWTTTAELPKNDLPPVYYTTPQQFAAAVLNHGKVFNGENILPNQVLVSDEFAQLGSRNEVTSALNLPKNDVAISLESSIVDESGGAITPGDYVDIVASLLPNGGGTEGGAQDQSVNGRKAQTQFVLQNIKVIAVGPFVPGTSEGTTSVAASGSTMLTFQTDRHTAQLIQYLKDFGGSWNYSIVLRSAYSTKLYSESPVTSSEMFSLPHTSFQH